MSHVVSDPATTFEGANAPPSAHSCLLCRQRKVKCDKQQPCSNCVKAGVVCRHSAPAPPRRRKEKEKLSEEDLRRRLRRYETLLRSYGAKIEELQARDGEVALPDRSSSLMTSPSSHVLPTSQLEKQGMQAVSSGSSLHNLWTSLSDEILDGLSDNDENGDSSLDHSRQSPVEEPAIFSFDPRPYDSSLTHLHPPPLQIFRLWQTFLGNVNPLIKIIHVPTIQQQVLESSINMGQVSRPTEALMFAIYSCAIMSLGVEECEKLTGESKELLRLKYHKATQQALIRAGLFKTSDVIVLQAAVLFLISIRLVYDPGEFWILVGIVLRVGQRIGLHRECGRGNLPALETEIYRRLWWQMSVLDARGTERFGVGPSAVSRLWDIPLPLNINDSDLSSNMIVSPLSHVGATEMTFVLMMYEIGSFFRHSKFMAAYDGSWEKLSSHMVPLTEKDKVIDELEDIIQNKFLRYCDPSIPLYILARGMSQLVIGRMRLTTRHPRQYPDRGSSMSPEEKEKLFALCLTLIEQDNLIHSTACLRGFLWHVDLHFQLDAFVYLLSELQHRDSGPLSDKAWSQITEAFVHHPNMITNAKSPLYTAVGNLTLKSWNAREVAIWRQQASLSGGSTPACISLLRSQRNKMVQNSSFMGHAESGILITDSDALKRITDSSLENNNTEGIFDISLTTFAVLPLDMSPMDWNYWNDLMQGAEMPTIESNAYQMFNQDDNSYQDR